MAAVIGECLMDKKSGEVKESKMISVDLPEQSDLVTVAALSQS